MHEVWGPQVDLAQGYRTEDDMAKWALHSKEAEGKQLERDLNYHESKNKRER
jgi:hypothetical protein